MDLTRLYWKVTGKGVQGIAAAGPKLSKGPQTARGSFYRRVFRGEGAKENFRAILN